MTPDDDLDELLRHRFAGVRDADARRAGNPIHRIAHQTQPVHYLFGKYAKFRLHPGFIQ